MGLGVDFYYPNPIVKGSKGHDMNGNEIFTSIARNMAPDKLETLTRFHEAAKDSKWLPTEGRLDLLPFGFLDCRYNPETAQVEAQLNPMGMRVAEATEKLAKEATEAA